MENQFAELIIKCEEGYRDKPYYCSEKFPTVGYGERVGNKGDPLPNISRTKEEAIKFLRSRINELYRQLSDYKPKAFMSCSEQRKAVLISMAYQLGITGLLKFNKMWAALEIGDYTTASREMMDSRWAKQTPNRAMRHKQTMSSGSLDDYYITNGRLI